MRPVSILSAALAAMFGLNACTQTPLPEACTTRMSDLQTIGSHNSYKLAIPDDELALISATSPEWGAGLDYGHVSLSE
ncbi:MAG: Ca2+-dependent phosphoinositide-specific phospholipase C, partial [Pseudomonadota bacterium]